MSKYILKRLRQSVVVILIVSAFTYMLMYSLPGDPVYAILGSDITAEQYDIAFHEMNLDKPAITRYFVWFGNFLSGDLGTSFKYHMPVSTLIAERLKVTMYLGIISIILSSLLGMLFGIISGTKRKSAADNIITILANLGAVMPLFWIGVLGMYIFAMKLNWLPSFGFSFPVRGNIATSIKQTILPVFCLSLSSIASMTRQMRSSILEVVQQDYMRTARAKGLPEIRIILNHGLKNAMIPIATLIGMSFKQIVAGAVTIEIVFSIPGMGQLLVNSIMSKDIALIQACIMITAIVVALSNLLVDISYGYLDPRMRIKQG